LKFHLEGSSCLLSAGTPDSLVAHRSAPVQRSPNRLIGHLPFQVGTGLSGGTSDMFDDPPDCCRADVADADRVVDRWHGAETLLSRHTEHVGCTPYSLVNFVQHARELLESGQLTRPAPDMSSAHLTVRWCLVWPNFSYFVPNFFASFWLNLKSSLALR
jgi:hypothetical protein